MKRTLMIGLCLASAFLMTAVAVDTASATTPEFIFGAGSKAFSSKSGAGKLEDKAGATVSCTSDTDSGEIEGGSGSKKVTDVLVAFKGCRSKVLTKEYTCTSTGANIEEIRTTDLEGVLGYINSKTTPREVGLLLNPIVAGGPFAEFECTTVKAPPETIKIKVKGSIIGKIEPVNTLVDLGESLLLKYKKGTNKGEPGVKVFEGGTEKKLETSVSNLSSGAFEESGLETTDEIFPLISILIRA